MSTDFWVWTKKHNGPLDFFSPLSELQPLSSHEEQLPRPASRCAHRSAAVSGLLWHQMAVSILGIAAISFFRQVTFPLLCIRTMPPHMTAWKICVALQLYVSVSAGALGSSKMGPNIPPGQTSVLGTCGSDEGHSRLTSSSSDYLCVPLICSMAVCISVPGSQVVERTPCGELKEIKTRK